MSLIVKKFGGTSVNSDYKINRIIEIVKKEKEKSNDLVLVVSAMGRLGDPYSTDTLLNLLPNEESNPIFKDLISSCGETITACILADALEKNGISAFPMTGLQAGIYTNSNFGDANIMNIDVSNINKKLSEGKVVIVTGFQGFCNDNLITTLGRGGSDITAISVGKAINADEVYIYTDVQGIGMSDPRLVENCIYLDEIDFDSLYFLSLVGNKVMHHRAVKIAMDSNKSFIVKSLLGDSSGTIVRKDLDDNSNKVLGLSILKKANLYKINDTHKVHNIINNKVSFFEDSQGVLYSLELLDNMTSENLIQFDGYDLLSLCISNHNSIDISDLNLELQKKGYNIKLLLTSKNKFIWIINSEESANALKDIYRNINSIAYA